MAETGTDGTTIRYLRGYELISSDSESARTYYHYVSDEQGSITHILREDEEGNHHLCNQYEYGAFGDCRQKEEEIPNRFGYTGQQYDAVTGQYYLRARYYNPVIGRFTQEDTYYGDGLNLYAYCRNLPIGYSAPTGYSPCKEKQDLYKKYREQGYNAQDANRMANYELIRKNQGIDAAERYLQNERETGQHNNKLKQESRDTRKTDTVWDHIIATQETYPGTKIPRSFVIEVNGERMWVHGNATEHMYESVYKAMQPSIDPNRNNFLNPADYMDYNNHVNLPPAVIDNSIRTGYINPDLYTQLLLEDFRGSLSNATASGIDYDKKIISGKWEFIFSPPRADGQLPVVKHSVFYGWGGN